MQYWRHDFAAMSPGQVSFHAPGLGSGSGAHFMTTLSSASEVAFWAASQCNSRLDCRRLNLIVIISWLPAKLLLHHGLRLLIMCPLARTNDHAGAVLMRSDTPGTPIQDPQSTRASAGQVKEQALGPRSTGKVPGPRRDLTS